MQEMLIFREKYNCNSAKSVWHLCAKHAEQNTKLHRKREKTSIWLHPNTYKSKISEEGPCGTDKDAEHDPTNKNTAIIT